MIGHFVPYYFINALLLKIICLFLVINIINCNHFNTVKALVSDHLGNSKKWSQLELVHAETITRLATYKMYKSEFTGHASTEIENVSY